MDGIGTRSAGDVCGDLDTDVADCSEISSIGAESPTLDTLQSQSCNNSNQDQHRNTNPDVGFGKRRYPIQDIIQNLQ
jgi:hypothetical protein